MADVSAEILEAIEKNFEKFYQDPVVKRIYGKIYEGTATYTDSHTLASLVARYKREAIEKAYLEAEKTGKLAEDVYGQIVKGTLDPELRDGRYLVAEACGYVQKDLNHKSGIGLGVVDPGLNESRVDGLVKYVTEANEPKLSSTVVPGLIDTFCRSAVDEYLEANLDFQKESGLSPQISRTRGANSNPKCAFCAGLVFTGDYKGEDMPDEIFARHRYCHCNLLYMDGSGSVQDSWSKKEYASYQEAEKAQRQYLTNLDKMTKDERWEVRKQKDREQRRARRLQKKAERVNPSELRAMEYIDGWYARDRAASGVLPLAERKEYDGLITGTPATGMTAQKRAAYAARKVREAVANGGGDDIITEGRRIDFYAGLGNKVLEAEYADWIGDNQYEKLMQQAAGEESKRYIRTAYRRSSIIGDGGTVDVRRFEKATGRNLGRGGGNHQKKVDDLIKQINRSLSKPINDEEKRYLLEELRKLQEVSD